MFQERYKSETVENEAYLLTVLRYIHQNPVKAGLTKAAQDYKWSSYFEYINKPVLTDIEFVLNIISANRERAIISFIEYTDEQNTDICLDYDETIRITDEDIRGYIYNMACEIQLNYSNWTKTKGIK